MLCLLAWRWAAPWRSAHVGLPAAASLPAWCRPLARRPSLSPPTLTGRVPLFLRRLDFPCLRTATPPGRPRPPLAARRLQPHTPPLHSCIRPAQHPPSPSPRGAPSISWFPHKKQLRRPPDLRGGKDAAARRRELPRARVQVGRRQSHRLRPREGRLRVGCRQQQVCGLRRLLGPGHLRPRQRHGAGPAPAEPSNAPRCRSRPKGNAVLAQPACTFCAARRPAQLPSTRTQRVGPNPQVNAALAKQLEKGTSFGAPCALEAREAIRDPFPRSHSRPAPPPLCTPRADWARPPLVAPSGAQPRAVGQSALPERSPPPALAAE